MPLSLDEDLTLNVRVFSKLLFLLFFLLGFSHLLLLCLGELLIRLVGLIDELLGNFASLESDLAER